MAFRSDRAVSSYALTGVHSVDRRVHTRGFAEIKDVKTVPLEPVRIDTEMIIVAVATSVTS